MTVSESARLALYNSLGKVIGPENADSHGEPPDTTRSRTGDEIGHWTTRPSRELTAEMRGGFNEIQTAPRQQMIATFGALTALTDLQRDRLSDRLEEQLGNLHGIERSALSQVVAHHPQVYPPGLTQRLPHPAGEDVVDSGAIQWSGNSILPQ